MTDDGLVLRGFLTPPCLFTSGLKEGKVASPGFSSSLLNRKERENALKERFELGNWEGDLECNPS